MRVASVARSSSSRPGGYAFTSRPDRDADERRVDPGLERREPHACADDRVGGRAPDAEPAEEEHDAEQPDGDTERDRVDALRVDAGDDGERADVVRDREGQDEDAEAKRAAAAEERDHAERERGVGRDHDPPALARVAREREVGERGHDHPADRRRDRNADTAAVAELAHVELAADLEPDDEEEERHQAVVHPVAEVLREHPVAEPERELRAPELLVGIAPRPVRPHERHEHRGEQGDGAAGLSLEVRPQRLRDVAHPRRAAYRCGLGLGVGHAGSLLMRGRPARSARLGLALRLGRCLGLRLRFAFSAFASACSGRLASAAAGSSGGDAGAGCSGGSGLVSGLFAFAVSGAAVGAAADAGYRRPACRGPSPGRRSCPFAAPRRRARRRRSRAATPASRDRVRGMLDLGARRLSSPPRVRVPAAESVVLEAEVVGGRLARAGIARDAWRLRRGGHRHAPSQESTRLCPARSPWPRPPARARHAAPPRPAARERRRRRRLRRSRPPRLSPRPSRRHCRRARP